MDEGTGLLSRLAAWAQDAKVIWGGLGAIAAAIALGPRVWRTYITPRLDRRRARRDQLQQIVLLHSTQDVADAIRALPEALKAFTAQLTSRTGISLADDVERLTDALKGVTDAFVLLRARLDLALNMSDQASSTADDHGSWIDVTVSMVRQTGRSESELKGRNWFSAIDEADRKSVKIKWEESVAEKGDFDSIFQWHHRDGTYTLVHMTAWYVHSVRKFVISSRKQDPEIAKIRERRGFRSEEVTAPPAG